MGKREAERHFLLLQHSALPFWGAIRWPLTLLFRWKALSSLVVVRQRRPLNRSDCKVDGLVSLLLVRSLDCQVNRHLESLPCMFDVPPFNWILGRTPNATKHERTKPPGGRLCLPFTASSTEAHGWHASLLE